MGLFKDMKTISFAASQKQLGTFNEDEQPFVDAAIDRIKDFFTAVARKIKSIFDSIVNFFRKNADPIFLSMVDVLENSSQLPKGSSDKVKKYIMIKNRTKSKRIRKKQYRNIGIASSKFI